MEGRMARRLRRSVAYDIHGKPVSITIYTYTTLPNGQYVKNEQCFSVIDGLFDEEGIPRPVQCQQYAITVYSEDGNRILSTDRFGSIHTYTCATFAEDTIVIETVQQHNGGSTVIKYTYHRDWIQFEDHGGLTVLYDYDKQGRPKARRTFLHHVGSGEPILHEVSRFRWDKHGRLLREVRHLAGKDGRVKRRSVFHASWTYDDTKLTETVTYRYPPAAIKANHNTPMVASETFSYEETPQP